MIDRSAPLTTANIRASGPAMKIEWDTNGLADIELPARFGNFRIRAWRFWNGQRNIHLLAFTDAPYSWSCLELAPLSTVGQLIDLYESLSGKKWDAE